MTAATKRRPPESSGKTEVEGPRRTSQSHAFDFESKYVTIQRHKIHYVETGTGKPILFVHGNPTSSYTFRNVLGPVARGTGRRSIALDLLGFGKSEKPRSVKYTVSLHRDVLLEFIERLGLSEIVLVAEDWGGFLGGLAMVASPERFVGAALMETFLWPLTWAEDMDPEFVGPFRMMRSPLGFLFTRVMNLMVNKLIPDHCPISDESLRYYKESLPNFGSRKAMGEFPKLIPIDGDPSESHRLALELQQGLPRLTCPVLWIQPNPGVIVSMNNPVGMGRLEALQKAWPQMEVADFGPGYHFLSEENPELVARLVVDWCRKKLR